MMPFKYPKHKNIQVFQLGFFTVHLKMVNLTVYKLDLNKPGFKKNFFNYLFTHVCNFHKGINVTTHAIS